ncbi:MAG: hypothetical protein C5B49_08620 [Bdellovibrio sp.]|nr:MAG: hypothetical protein C5B49_08620 [Bdellovibrio sp.]
MLIVSAFGRGHALAMELAQSEVPVLLVDVSGSLGTAAAEDEEGPFGFFSQGLRQTESQRLLEDQAPLMQVNGFTWVFGEGPFEMKGPLTMDHRVQLRIPENVWNWVCFASPSANRDLQFLAEGEFDQTWLYHLARSFFANEWNTFQGPGLLTGSLPLASDFFVRSMSRAARKKSFEALRRSGVQVREGASVVDLAKIGSGVLQSLEVRLENSDTAELLTFDHLVWFLSGEETEKMSQRLREKMFEKGILQAKGSWVRARLKWPALPQRECLPLHSVWVTDRVLPWSHQNLFVLQRTTNADLFDLWFRIPETFRFQKEYVLRHLQEIQGLLERRLGFQGIEVNDPPLCAVLPPQAVGPARHPLFDPQELAAYSPPHWTNFDWVGAEACQGLGWNYLLIKARKVGSDVLEKWKQSRLRAERLA